MIIRLTKIESFFKKIIAPLLGNKGKIWTITCSRLQMVWRLSFWFCEFHSERCKTDFAQSAMAVYSMESGLINNIPLDPSEWQTDDSCTNGCLFLLFLSQWHLFRTAINSHLLKFKQNLHFAVANKALFLLKRLDVISEFPKRVMQ